jgi:hypothetical protein
MVVLVLLNTDGLKEEFIDGIVDIDAADETEPRALNWFDVSSFSSQKHDSRVIIKSPPSSWKNITLIAILLAGDIQLNPGPSVYPYGYWFDVSSSYGWYVKLPAFCVSHLQQIHDTLSFCRLFNSEQTWGQLLSNVIDYITILDIVIREDIFYEK